MTPSEPAARRWPALLALAAVVAGLALQFHLIFLVNINWDEFQRLARVHELVRGDPMAPFHSAWIHAFTWLVALPGDEIDQILAGRIVSFFGEIFAFAGVFVLARRFVPPASALFGLLTLLSTSYILRHGFSFRSDPIVVALGVWAMVSVLTTRRSPRAAAAGAGALLALALLVSIKSALLVLPVGGALLLAPAKRRLPRLAVLLATTAVTFGALHLVHAASLPPRATATAASAALPPLALASLAKTALLPRTMPGWSYLPESVRQSPLVWLCLLGGLAMTITDLRRRKVRGSALLLIALASPLATFAFYRNTFPYFYLFALAPAAPLAAVFLTRLRGAIARRSPAAASLAVSILWAGTAITLVTHYARSARDGMASQREIVRTIHRLFPAPVPYIDRCSMIASFPKVGFFMTGWGMERYYARRRPMMRQALLERQPVFLIVNSPGLVLHLPEKQARRAPYALLPEDRRTLRENFVHHWGWIWVAGKEVVVPADTSEAEFEILVAGPYTLESESKIRIDDVAVTPGQAIHLSAGAHHAAAEHATVFRLRWGSRLPRPRADPTPKPIFTGF